MSTRDETGPGCAVGARRVPPVGRSGETRITLVGRPGCHLCDEAEAVIERVARDLRVGWTKLNIDEDPDLHARYSEQIPVTLVDGRQHDFWKVSERRLRAALSG